VAPLITRLNSKGQLTLPRRLRGALGVKPGDYLALTPTEAGVLITAAAELHEGRPETALAELVRSLGEQLEREGMSKKSNSMTPSA